MQKMMQSWKQNMMKLSGAKVDTTMDVKLDTKLDAKVDAKMDA